MDSTAPTGINTEWIAKNLAAPASRRIPIIPSSMQVVRQARAAFNETNLVSQAAVVEVAGEVGEGL